MQGNLINNYIQPKTSYTSQSANVAKTNDGIEIVTRRKAKPNFDINRELANRTFIKPLPPKGHLVKDGIMAAPAVFVKDMAYDMKALKAAWKGDANDHQLGKLNDLGMKLGGLGVASYLFTVKGSPVKKGMEFVGLASFFASMSLWPKIALEIPARIIHGFNPFMQYEDSQGRKKPLFQDNQYLPLDLISDKKCKQIGDKNGIPKNMPDRRDAEQDYMRRVALQNNTMWMLTAGFATPVMSSLICNRLEPYVEDAYSYFMNRKADNILVNFAEAQKKYANKDIEKNVSNLLEEYKGQTLDSKLLEKLSTAMTETLGPKVALGVKADLENIFSNNKFMVSETQVTPLRKSISAAIKASNLVNDATVSAIAPSQEQLMEIFEKKKYVGNVYSAEEMTPIKNDVVDLIQKNVQKARANGISISPNVSKRIVKEMFGKTEMSGPIMKILTNNSVNILDDNAQEIIENLQKRISSLSAEDNALNMYSFRKLASAPDTAKGKFWTDVANSFIDILEISPEEIKNNRYDRTLVANLIQNKMRQLAVNPEKYDKVMKAAAAKLSQIEKNIKPDNMTGKYLSQVQTSFNAAAEDLRRMGFVKTAERLVGKNGNEAGSLINLKKMFVTSNLSDVQNSFARFFNTMNFYRAIVNDANLNFALNGEGANVPREIKEELAALGEYLSTSGRISDYSVKFEFLRNLRPNKDDKLPLEIAADGIKYKYYNKTKLAKDGVLIPHDVNFFKREMSLLYGGNIQAETDSALSEYSSVREMLHKYRHNMLHQVGDLENFHTPNHVVHDNWSNCGRVYSKATVRERSLCVGNALDELIFAPLKRSYNTRQWLKTFGGFGAGLLGFTVLSQFFFGRTGNLYNKKQGQK